MATKTILPALPSYIDERNLRDAVQALSEIAGVWLGERSDPLDRVVTIRDLAAGGIARPTYVGGYVGLAPADDGDAINDDAIDNIPPPAPTGFSASGGIGNVILTWDNPYELYKNHAYTEIYRASVNDLGDAVLQDNSSSFIWADYTVESGNTYYYWIRFVSTAGVAGAWNAIGGTSSEVSHDPGYLMEVLSDEYGGGSDSPFFRLDAPTEINGVVVPAGTYIKDAYIHEAMITSAMVQSLNADKIVASSLSAISADLGEITAGSLNINGKFIVDAAGNTTIQSATTGERLVIQNNVIKVFDANGTLRVRIGDLTA